MEAFTLTSEISEIEIIAKGASIRVLPLLNKTYGKGNWRKLKGIAQVRTSEGNIRLAEIHWYEAHGIGRRDYKVKKYLSDEK